MPAPLLPYDDARAIVLEQRFDYGTEHVALAHAAGRTLAEDVRTDRALPPFDRVSMDGFAFAQEDYATGQRRFRVAGLQAAGVAPQSLPSGAGAAGLPTCIEIMTGAVLPKGATTVVPYEDVARDGDDVVVLPGGLVSGSNVHALGADQPAGSVLAKAPLLVTATAAAALATCGYGEVAVRRLPRVAVVTTGDELVAVATTPLPHQIRRSNDLQAATVLRAYGISADRYHVADDERLLATRLGEWLDSYDVLVLSGGVSKGKFDYVPGVLSALGVGQLLHRVAQRPGKPLWVGRTATAMVFGLPGNPVSGLACLHAYVLPWLRLQLGLPEPTLRYCQLGSACAFAKPLTLLQLVRVEQDERGVCVATPVRNQGSGDGASTVRATGFAVLAAQRERFSRGEVVPYLPFVG